MNSPTPGFTFGMRLRDVREGQGLTKSAMAKSLGIAPSTWSSYENDITFPSQDTIDLFCQLYNVNIGWLMTNEGPEYILRTMIQISRFHCFTMHIYIQEILCC